MDFKKQIDSLRRSLILNIYCLFFVFLSLWASIPILLADTGILNSINSSYSILTATFSILCLISSFGIAKKNRIFGYALGNIVLLLTLTYQVGRFFNDPSSNPILLFSIINFGIVLVVFTKILKPEFQAVPIDNHTKS